jgi:hypothetical protein
MATFSSSLPIICGSYIKVLHATTKLIANLLYEWIFIKALDDIALL